MWEWGEHHSQPNTSGEMYYYSRNIPHPRMVFHMPGLNNAPVCVVTSCFSRERPSAGKAGTPEQEHEQEHVLPEITTGKSPAHLPEVQSFVEGKPGTAGSTTRRADLLERIPNHSASSGKLLKRRAQASAQSASSQGSQAVPCNQPSSARVPLHCGPRVQDTKSCLDVMEKLTRILKTDSFAETQKWFARASKEEKDLVSGQIFPDLSDRGVLKPKEGMAEKNSVQPVLKPLPPLQSGPGGIINQTRKEECPVLSNTQHRTSTRRSSAPREEQLWGKRNGSNRPSRLPALPEVSAMPQPTPKPSGGRPAEELKHHPASFSYRNK